MKAIKITVHDQIIFKNSLLINFDPENRSEAWMLATKGYGRSRTSMRSWMMTFVYSDDVVASFDPFKVEHYFENLNWRNDLAKIFEFRDSGTFMPVLAAVCGNTIEVVKLNHPNKILTAAEIHPRVWKCVEYVKMNFNYLEAGSLVDARYLLNEADEPCVTDMRDSYRIEE